MRQLLVEVGAADVVVHVDRGEEGSSVFGLPFGIERLLTGELHSDPPRPEELTNAIGSVVDHLDDLVRDDPYVLGAATSLRGPEVTALAAVEFGGDAVLPFLLERAAAEEVFRMLATEGRADRAHNPGLVPDLVDRVVAGSCIVVGLMRRLHLDAVTVVA